jgi:hypothetical protein
MVWDARRSSHPVSRIRHSELLVDLMIKPAESLGFKFPCTKEKQKLEIHMETEWVLR